MHIVAYFWTVKIRKVFPDKMNAETWNIEGRGRLHKIDEK